MNTITPHKSNMTIGHDTRSGKYTFEITGGQYNKLLKGHPVQKITGNHEHNMVIFTLTYEVIQ